jgi:S-DNA-T family DNA segregation ATPase FtsK/SpoIIIE
MAWRTPSSDILATPPIQDAGTVISAEYLKEVLSINGCPCECVSKSHGATVSTFYFDYKLRTANDLDRFNKVVKRVVPFLTAKLKRTVDLAPPAPEKGHFGIVIPREKRQTVYFKNALLADVPKFVEMSENGYIAALGMDNEGNPMYVDLPSMPHCLISGASGGGKSVLMNTILCSLLMRNSPNAMKIIGIDTKMVELSNYQNLPHLYKPIVTEPKAAVETLAELCDEMQNRYAALSRNGLKSFADIPKGEYCNFPLLLLVIDEFADLIMVEPEVEHYIIRLAQKGRAAGICCLVASQSPNANVITKAMRVNFSTRIALSCSSPIDSRIATSMTTDLAPANKLLGRGDALYIYNSTVTRFQTAYCDEKSIISICDWWKNFTLQQEELTT